MIIPLVSLENYILLSESNPLCVRNGAASTSFSLLVPDQLTLQEQLVFTQSSADINLHLNDVDSPVSSTSHSVNSTRLRPILGVCSGIVITPHGRFVQQRFAEGIISFWLIRVEAVLNCSTPGYIIFDQWIEGTSFWQGFRHNGDYESRTSALINEPDTSDRLDCSQPRQGEESQRRLQLAGYLRRLRLRWHLQDDQSTDSRQPNGEDPGAGLQIRITTRLVIDGNFSGQQSRSMCEFFSGYWCPTNQSIDSVPAIDSQACIRAAMHCDGLPDCNPTVGLGPENQSADEMNCDWSRSPADHLIAQGQWSASANGTASATVFDRWSSNLLWIVLLPIPLVLVCALVRICSQKRHLDDIPEEEGEVADSERAEKAPAGSPTHWTLPSIRQYLKGRPLVSVRTAAKLPIVAEMENEDLAACETHRSSSDGDLLHRTGQSTPSLTASISLATVPLDSKERCCSPGPTHTVSCSGEASVKRASDSLCEVVANPGMEDPLGSQRPS